MSLEEMILSENEAKERNVKCRTLTYFCRLFFFVIFSTRSSFVLLSKLCMFNSYSSEFYSTKVFYFPFSLCFCIEIPIAIGTRVEFMMMKALKTRRDHKNPFLRKIERKRKDKRQRVNRLRPRCRIFMF